MSNEETAISKDDDNQMSCEICGEKDWIYLGEAYDDDVHMGGLYMCQECGHHQVDED